MSRLLLKFVANTGKTCGRLRGDQAQGRQHVFNADSPDSRLMMTLSFFSTEIL
jgi:hypothetical protein